MYGLTSACGPSAACFQYQQHSVYLEQRGRRLDDMDNLGPTQCWAESCVYLCVQRHDKAQLQQRWG